MHKLLFRALAIVVFVSCVWVGYGLLPTAQTYKDKGVIRSPKSEEDVFLAQFATAQKTKKRKFFPSVTFMAADESLTQFERVQDDTPYILVNIWARWCAPCVKELPSLQKLGRYAPDDLKVVAIAYEQGKKPKEIADFLKKYGIGEFAGFVDYTGDLAQKLSIRGIPTSFLVGKDGQILYRFEGDANWASPESLRFFDVLLSSSISTPY